MIGYISKGAEYIFPLFILFTVLKSLFTKSDTVANFAKGFSDGIKTIWYIMPNIVAVMTAVALFRETGAFSFFAKFLAPVFSVLKIPEGLYEMVIMRPVSGSGSVALLTNILDKYGADSKVGLIASVIAASTETTLYTIAVYFGATNAKKTGTAIFVGLITDVFTVLFAVFVINLLF